MQETMLRRWGINSFVLIGLLALWLTQPYLLFHTVIESVSLFLALSLYLIGTQTHRFSKNGVLLFFGIAFMYVGLFDALHTLTYRGMDLAAWGTPNISTQFWIAGRMLQMLTLSSVLVLSRCEVSRLKLEAFMFAVAVILAVLIFTGVFPDCNVEGLGLTPFKKTVEYVIVGMAALAIPLVGKVGFLHSARIIRNVRLALVLLIASELSFTLYKDAYGMLNAAGHFFKVMSYQYVWSMVLDEGFAKPYEHLFHDAFSNSVKDQLTGLYNRRYFDQKIGPYIDGSPGGFSLVMADVNGLKLINDAFGHDEGDRQLKVFAEVLRRHCSDEDPIMRIGGDEFLMLLPGRTVRDSMELIGRMKEDFGTHSTRGIAFSASFGCTEKWDRSESKEILYNRAESEMYRNKVAESPVMKNRIMEGVRRYIQEMDPVEQAHSDAVAAYAEQIAQYLGLSTERVRQVGEAASLHDIGKIRFINGSVSDGARSGEPERSELRRHPEVGHNLLVSLSEYAQQAPFVLHHHERWDGSGYPLGLSGEDIPLESRIIAVAEAYDALLTGSAKPAPQAKDEAIAEIMRCAGTQFDPAVAKAFIKILVSL